MKNKKWLAPVWRQRIGLYGGILLILLIAAAVPRIYNFNQSATLAAPGEDVPPAREIPDIFYPMADPAYQNEPIGQSGFTIGEAGSLLCTLATDTRIDPAELNRLLQESVAYDENGTILWDKANAVISAYTEGDSPRAYTVWNKPDPSLALNSLKAGKSVLLKISDGENRALWLWLSHIQDGRYYAYDPQLGDTLPLDQSERVYGVAIGSPISAKEASQ